MVGNVYQYTDYKRYVSDWIRSRGGTGRGERSRMAKSLNCHVAYISRVLNGEAHLSFEQGDRLNRHMAHLSDESDYFLLLLSFGRAGTKELQDYYQQKIQGEVERRAILKNRLEFRKSLSAVDQATYFSAWYFSAIHLLIGVPGMQTKEALMKHLRISPTRVSSVLHFLVSSGLVVESKGRYSVGPTSIHLGNDSSMISKHHTNWRIQAIRALERERPEDLHYSSAVTVSRKDIPEIRNILVSAIEKVRALVKDSAEESLYCYSLDLFEIGGEGG